MESELHPYPTYKMLRQRTLADEMEEWKETCKNCHPITPLTCLNNCKIWNLKNQLKKLNEKAKKPNFMEKLLNTLKNKKRLQILELITKGQYSIAKLQNTLKTLGHHHSRRTITKEYIGPLVDVGLAEENQNQYGGSLFGYKIAELIKGFHDFEKLLPPHSKCREEKVLSLLLSKPKTYEELKEVIPKKNITRVLKRLKTAGLIEQTKERAYIFFFRTKRDPDKEKFSPTERRTYENIPPEGISAQKLAEMTRISLRRTYKYLRRLRGKKLVFTRRKPKSYALTAKGTQLALVLEDLHDLTMEFLAVASQFTKEKETSNLLMPSTSQIMRERTFKL